MHLLGLGDCVGLPIDCELGAIVTFLEGWPMLDANFDKFKPLEKRQYGMTITIFETH